jgi:tRNA threonylcarbamoyl adenosine modification protein YeaZ
MLLALDTATPYLVLGLPRAERAVRYGRRHAEVLWEELESFLLQNQIARADLKGVVVGCGPGSYTGLRIGVSAGLGLGRALGIPVVGVGTLEAVAGDTAIHTTQREACYVRYSREPAQRSLVAELRPQDQKQGRISVDGIPSGRKLVQLGSRALALGKLGAEPLYL